jgi:glycosyltransferase involved in cell wall biosynthesis
VGGFQNGRGIHHMLKSFSNSNINSHVVFVGYGELENEIKKFSKKYNNIHILKTVAHDTLVQFISSANVGLCIIEKVSLSDFYCLPNKFFEYAFANLYILASNFPDMKRLIKTYSLGSCIPPNTNALIRKIKFLENNKKKTKVLKRNLVDLQWQSQSQILIRSYLNILKKN